jgi:hypothetical protein
VRFFGEKKGNELAQLYAEADVFVFPSKTDTFGNVILEALASGVPVAAYPVPGPLDILTDPQVGALHDNLAIAVRQALANGCPAACHALAKQYTWERSTDQFLQALLPAVPAAAVKHDAAWQDTSFRLPTSHGAVVETCGLQDGGRQEGSRQTGWHNGFFLGRRKAMPLNLERCTLSANNVHLQGVMPFRRTPTGTI